MLLEIRLTDVEQATLTDVLSQILEMEATPIKMTRTMRNDLEWILEKTESALIVED